MASQPGLIDFSPIGDFAKSWAEGSERAKKSAFEDALKGIPTGPGGVIDYNALVQRAAQAGYTPGLQMASQLASAQAQREHQAAELGLSKRRVDLAQLQYEEGKLPQGYMRGPDGTLAHVPGGPADPAVLQAVTDAKAKPREFNVSDVTKLEEEGKKYSNITRYADTFQPHYGGYVAPVIGDAAMKAGRYLPESVVGKNTAQAAAWWADYQRSKNQIRNDLFGSALTATEAAEFNKADIDPGMDPKQIQANLATQKRLTQTGLMRKANALIASGYDPKAIGAAYGLDLKDLGVTATGGGRRGGAAAPAPAPAPAKPVEYDHPEISEARTLIGQGRLTRENAEKKLRAHGIPFKPGDLDL